MKYTFIIVLCFVLMVGIQAQSTYIHLDTGINAVESHFQKSKRITIYLANLLNRRLSYMKDVAAFKWTNHLNIEDLEREKVVLENSIIHAGKYGLDSLSVQDFFENQIILAKKVQQFWFDQWNHRGFENYNYADLDSVRFVLNTQGNEILGTIHILESGHVPEGQLNKISHQFVDQLNTKGISLEDKIYLFKALIRIKVL